MTPPPFSCSHTEAKEWGEVCFHLVEHSDQLPTDDRFYRCFSGRGLQRTLLCHACGAKGPETDVRKIRLCEECLQCLEENGGRIGDWGAPGYPVRDIGLQLASSPLLPFPEGARVMKIAPIHASDGSDWLALTDRHELLRIEFNTGNCRRICGITDLGLPIDKELSLEVSNHGEFAAIVTTFGQTGVVVDVASGKTLMALDRGNYHTGHCRFPAVFFEHEGRTLLVHATAWNRLDVSDPRTGSLLTSRTMPAHRAGERMPHYLDYFHCGLVVSPDGEWIADNGWAWSPAGLVRTWNLRRWLTENVWESEDGATARYFAQRHYYWDGPLCWVTKRKIAVWGVGGDHYSLLPAVRLIDVTTGEETPPLIGPFGPAPGGSPAEPRFQPARSPLQDKGVLEFDQYLFAWSPAAGFSVWDIADGARLFAAEGFCPLAYNRVTRQFFSQDIEGKCSLSKLVKAG